jgi:hypothetical protein
MTFLNAINNSVRRNFSTRGQAVLFTALLFDLEVPSGENELRLTVLDNKTGFIGTVSGSLGQLRLTG